jgi:adenylosuccinate lyase
MRAFSDSCAEPQKEGWVNIEGVCQFVGEYGCSREDAYELVAQLVRAKILEERQNEDQLQMRMAIPLLRKRYVRQNMHPKYFRAMTKSKRT